MAPRLNYVQLSSEHFKKFLDFSLGLKGAALGETIRGLVDLRVSQINGCALCLDMHVKEAKIRGERELRLHHVAIWRESPLFDPREKAALEWTETLTKIPPHGVSDELFAETRRHFSEKELSDLTFAVMTINAWNRLNVAFRTEPGAQDKALGLDKAGLI